MKNTLKLLGTAFSLASLAACSSSSSDSLDHTLSGFKTPTTGSSATIPVELDNEQNGRVYNSMFGGVAYVTGTDGDGAKAYAGIIPESNPGATVTSGSVIYDTNYKIAAIERISVSNGVLTGYSTTDSGSLTLTADFNENTLTGSDGTFTVDGQVSGGNISGSVQYDGVNGELAGLIGEDAVIGAFHGNNSRTVYSGGFIGTN